MKRSVLFCTLAILTGTTGLLDARVVSGDPTNPTTQGYATVGAAAKDRKTVAAPKKARSGKVAEPIGASPAEAAGASTPDGPPQKMPAASP